MNTHNIPQHIYDALPDVRQRHDDVALPRDVAAALATMKADAGNDPIKLAAWKARRDGAIEAVRAAAQPQTKPGTNVYTNTDEINGPSTREIEARKKMIADSASAHLGTTDDTDERPSAPTIKTAPTTNNTDDINGPTRELAARDAMRRASREAHKEGR